MTKAIIVKNLSIGTNKPMTFVDELDKLCKRFANKTKGGKDYYFDWEGE